MQVSKQGAGHGQTNAQLHFNDVGAAMPVWAKNFLDTTDKF
jgi:hypothetical protein